MSNTQPLYTAIPARQRLRAVRSDEDVPAVAAPDFLPPGAIWMPAPGHTVPAAAGQSAMVGYLVLVPTDPAPSATSEPALPPAGPTGQDVPESAIRVDRDRRTATVEGRTLDLTYLEFELLAHLVAHPRRVHTRDQLVNTVWGYGHVGDGRTVDVHVARLRRKLGPKHRRRIITVRRVGYKYAPTIGD